MLPIPLRGMEGKAESEDTNKERTVSHEQENQLVRLHRYNLPGRLRHRHQQGFSLHQG